MVNTTLHKPATDIDSEKLHGLYLYGILPGDHALTVDCIGLDKQPVQLHHLDQFVFLYSIAQQERYLASRKNLLGHERVLEHVMSVGGRNVLPLQFGLVIESWDTVYAQLIETHRNSLIDLFEKLENRREVSIKVMWDTGAELEMLMNEDDALRHERDRLEGKTLSMEEVVAIGQAIEQAMNDRKHSIIEAFQSVLDVDVVDVIENDPMTSEMIYNAAYLIDWDGESAFSEKVDALDKQFNGRLHIRYNNFTAPFNFAQIERD
ncbi:MAG: GvpL/GvpF family gas vesicle protein [Cyanobacteria bacterium J06627_8]